MRHFLLALAVTCAVAAPVLRRATPTYGAQDPHRSEIFKTSDQCMACHNGLRASSGEDVSIGASWRTSMMANSSRDPYWQAGVRREVIDHPSAADAIQDECAACHMPMSRTEARMTGTDGRVFDHLPVGAARERRDSLAHDGVACSLCHQITGQNFGASSSFTGGYIVTPAEVPAPRPIFGPFRIERGLTTIMKSATGFEPSESPHVRQSELCATCHTLVTKARGPSGDIVGELPEQMPFLEWKHSAFVAEERSCQSCHMPVVEEEIPIASVLGAPRKGFARHTFVGGNAFMQRMLNRFRSELNVQAPAGEMDAAVEATVRNLQSHTARLSIEMAEALQGRLVADIKVENITGHKLPTGYPSRRVWLHVTVRDGAGRIIFESGALEASGAIKGNDHDADRLRVEPHYTEIRQPDEVQIYESVMRDRAGLPTTGLLSATGYAKDNRLLPRGFDKSTASEWIAVIGTAAPDSDFIGGADDVRYVVPLGSAQGPFHIDAALRFQVIGFRWAENLRSYDSEETRRFVTYYESMASSSSEALATASAVVP
jgi:cytochrome c551/c552